MRKVRKAWNGGSKEAAIREAAEREGEWACRAGKFSADNPYDLKAQHALFIAWDTGWHRSALEVFP
jgi:hypothetical protein